MSFYNLAEMMRKERERLDEETSSVDISYLPGGFTTMAHHLRSLSGLKTQWNVKIIDSDRHNYKVMFEDALNVFVPKTAWDEFLKRVLRIKGTPSADLKIDLGQYLKEARDKDVNTLYKKLDTALLELFINEPIVTVDRNYSLVIDKFGSIDHTTPKSVMLRFEVLEQDLARQEERIRKVYGDDIGSLEMLINAIQRRKPLSLFEVFQEYTFLVGSTVKCRVRATEFIYDTVVYMTFNPREEVIILNNPELLKTLSSDTSVKIGGDVVYPVGGMFDEKFFQLLKKSIEEA